MKSKKEYLDTKDWREFDFISLFTPVRGKLKNVSGMEEGATPIITASGFDNGVGKYGDTLPTYRKMLTLSNNGEKAGSCFWQEDDFAIVSDAYVLNPIGFQLNDLRGLFVASVINHKFKVKYNWDYKPSQERLERETICLPVDKQGNPDWIYMEDFMRTVLEQENQRIQKLI